MSRLWNKIARPIAFSLDAEKAHNAGIEFLKRGFAKPFYVPDSTFGQAPIDAFGLKFPNLLGLAAGFDKNGVVVNELSRLGFGFVEVGTVTFDAQEGNPKPRMFRLAEDKALINRLGFNNEGAESVAKRLRKLDRRCIVGVNIGKNKDVPNHLATENYLKTFREIYDVADYIAVNVSSPNTPNLRELQKEEFLDELVRVLQSENYRLAESAGLRVPRPLLVKIAPDLSDDELEILVDVVRRHRVSGMIATNTTIGREGLRSKGVEEIGQGGLSGRPLASRSNEVISAIYRYSKGSFPIIGVGGVFTPEDAYQKIAAGASLIQAYTGFVYGGPLFPKYLLSGLRRILREKGYSSASQAVGSAADNKRG